MTNQRRRRLRTNMGNFVQAITQVNAMCIYSI